MAIQADRAALVDDEPDVRHSIDVIGDTLDDAGFPMVAAHDGRDSLEQFAIGLDPAHHLATSQLPPPARLQTRLALPYGLDGLPELVAEREQAEEPPRADP